MIDAMQIREHMKVVGSDGEHVGTVDHMDGDRMIKLAKNDSTAQGQHHWIPLNWVSAVEQNQVRLNKSANEACDQWQMSGPTGAGAGI
ncbi:MAG: DUF2171 domain-containing protein [Gammaproteobacteria bacterium]